jgi:L-gulonate 5-dehydrogenase
MQAALFDAPFKLRITQPPKPEPKAGEALIAVKAAGLCAGDL